MSDGGIGMLNKHGITSLFLLPGLNLDNLCRATLRLTIFGGQAISVQDQTPENTTTAIKTAMNSTMAEATNQRTVFPYSISSSSAIRSEEHTSELQSLRHLV